MTQKLLSATNRYIEVDRAPTTADASRARRHPMPPWKRTALVALCILWTAVMAALFVWRYRRAARTPRTDRRIR